jgi:hypothetical protein
MAELTNEIGENAVGVERRANRHTEETRYAIISNNNNNNNNNKRTAW